MSHESIDLSSSLVSVVIPILGSAKNLEISIKSIIGQTLSKIEIILVDTGKNGENHQLCSNYAQDDHRVRVITANENSIGSACNAGIDASNGNYISFVFPSDWADPEMLENLYDQAVKHDVDVVASYFFSHESGSVNIDRNIANQKTLLNKIIRDRYLVSGLYLAGTPTFGQIYRADFLQKNNIRFRTDPSGLQTASIGFMFLVYSFMNSIFIYRAAYYHHDSKNDERENEGFQKAKDILAEHIYIGKLIDDRKIDDDIEELEAIKCFRDIRLQFDTNCSSLDERKWYLANSSDLLEGYLTYLYDNYKLSKNEKRLFRAFARHPVRTALLDKRNKIIKILRFLVDAQFKRKVTHIKIFKFPVIFIKNTEEYKTFNICKIPIRRVRKNVSGKEVRLKYYYFGLPIKKRIETSDYIRIYWLNIRVHKELNLEAKFNEINNRINELPSQEDIVYFSGMANIVTAVHSKVFPPFKNSNTGKSIAILGSGPSFNFAPKIASSKIIACNRSFMLLKDREPDYIFAHDYVDSQDYFDQVLKHKCPIFLGHFIFDEHNDLIVTPEKIRLQNNVYTYYSGFRFNKSMRTEIEYYPLATFTSIIDPALHFAFYTDPDVIYLIGCDFTLGGYANKNHVQAEEMQTIGYITGYHKAFKQYRDTHYPGTRVISVNPVNLRGIYEDVYTKGFLEQSDDLDASKVTIIEEI